jgi:hypothetical protein
LTPYFAEQLVPRLGDTAEEPAIRRRAEALAAAGRRLSGAALTKALLGNIVAKPSLTRPIWMSTDGKRSVNFTANRKGGGRIEVTNLTRAASPRT